MKNLFTLLFVSFLLICFIINCKSKFASSLKKVNKDRLQQDNLKCEEVLFLNEKIDVEKFVDFNKNILKDNEAFNDVELLSFKEYKKSLNDSKKVFKQVSNLIGEKNDKIYETLYDCNSFTLFYSKLSELIYLLQNEMYDNISTYEGKIEVFNEFVNEDVYFLILGG